MTDVRKVLRPADLTRQFNILFDSDEKLQENSVLAGEYSGGLLYLGGGTVYGNLANPPYEGDFDYLGERSIKGKSLERVDDWVGRYTSMGTIFFERKRGDEVEVVDIDYLANLMKDLANPTIGDYIKRRANFIYNVQNIVYDIKNRRVIAGNSGLKALNARILKFHYLNAAIVVAERKLHEESLNRRLTSKAIAEELEELISEKAKKIDFKYKMPSDLNKILSRRYA